MIEWLLAGIDSSRTHYIGDTAAWHARLLFIAWVLIAPTAIIISRFFKVTPTQNWPEELDNQFWWRSHWMGQTIAVLLTIVAVILVRFSRNIPDIGWHATLGYTVLVLACFQVLTGMIRGSKGGPTKPLADGNLMGHHYRMSRWRLVFEYTHKTLGYLLLVFAIVNVVQGLWLVNSPRWMWIVSAIWIILLVVWFVGLQKKGRAVDTYQAIWGPELEHPGNRRASTRWGMRRSPPRKGQRTTARHKNDQDTAD